MDLSFLQGNGWVGVAIGLLLFGMGYLKGASVRDGWIDAIIAMTIKQMVADRLVKTRRVMNDETGEWEEELLQYDEEV
jgi:uncharacterized membrane protein